jgi:putative endonuclease
MTKATRQTGVRGEQIARSILQSQGFRIEAANWRAGKLGEIDLIAFHPAQKLLALVEVKTRRSSVCGTALESVDPRKQAQLYAIAEAYLAQHPPADDTSIRFDVIAVNFPGQNKPAEVEHLENAFSY